ncbi:MAG: ComEC/Rec2 family competence protein [Actinomycetia bacterium]|nr:ComEC/Rec2 family competence protein [Actinomycetes bacterium]
MCEPVHIRFGALAPVPSFGVGPRLAAALCGAAIAGSWTGFPTGRVGFVVALGIVGFAGSVVSGPAPRPLRRRAAAVLVLALFFAVSDASARAGAGLSPPQRGDVDTIVTVVADPERRGRGVVAEVRWDRHRYEVWAFGRAANVLAAAMVGEQVGIIGRVAPFTEDWNGYVARHLVGRVSAEVVWRTRRGSGWWWATTNATRRHLADGADHLSATERGLLLGFTVGDDRELSPEVVGQFRASGLSHLTAVSGQNVVLILGLATPLLSRRSRVVRVSALIVVLLWFGALTRWEPSVIRAIAMAGVSVVSPVPAGRGPRLALLGLVVSGLILIDPLMIWSVGFRLSVAATAGLVVFADRIARWLPGPDTIVQPISVTAAAQIGVAPVQLATFGPMPLAALPANVAAGPVAGPLMVWGATVGLIAGWMPDGVAVAMHLPTRLMTGWVAYVARSGASSGLPKVGFPAFAAVVSVIVIWRMLRRGVPPSG